MNDVLVRIKRAIRQGNYIFSGKASSEIDADGLTELDVIESILNATDIYKTIRSDSLYRTQAREYLHIIQSSNLMGLMIYSKGKLVREEGIEVYYVLISAKKARY